LEVELAEEKAINKKHHELASMNDKTIHNRTLPRDGFAGNTRGRSLIAEEDAFLSAEKLKDEAEALRNEKRQLQLKVQLFSSSSSSSF
jgi:hypothetical protein